MKKREDAHPARFTTTQIVLHWTVAAFVTAQFFFNEAIQDDFDRSMDTFGIVWPSLMGWLHILVGTTILVLALWRLGLRFLVGAPKAALPAPKAAIWAGKVAHMALYGFLFMLPITGVLAFLGQSDLAAELHELLTWLLVPLILAHAAGALIEHALFGNATLTRMLDISGTGRSGSNSDPGR